MMCACTSISMLKMVSMTWNRTLVVYIIPAGHRFASVIIPKASAWYQEIEHCFLTECLSHTAFVCDLNDALSHRRIGRIHNVE